MTEFQDSLTDLFGGTRSRVVDTFETRTDFRVLGDLIVRILPEARKSAELVRIHVARTHYSNPCACHSRFHVCFVNDKNNAEICRTRHKADLKFVFITQRGKWYNVHYASACFAGLFYQHITRFLNTLGIKEPSPEQLENVFSDSWWKEVVFNE